MTDKACSKLLVELAHDTDVEIPDNWPQWRHVIMCAESLRVAATTPADCAASDIKLILETLASMGEVFPRSIDPLNDVPGYAFRQYCRAVEAVLDRHVREIGEYANSNR